MLLHFRTKTIHTKRFRKGSSFAIVMTTCFPLILSLLSPGARNGTCQGKLKDPSSRGRGLSHAFGLLCRGKFFSRDSDGILFSLLVRLLFVCLPLFDGHANEHGRERRQKEKSCAHSTGQDQFFEQDSRRVKLFKNAFYLPEYVFKCSDQIKTEILHEIWESEFGENSFWMKRNARRGRIA